MLLLLGQILFVFFYPTHAISFLYLQKAFPGNRFHVTTCDPGELYKLCQHDTLIRLPLVSGVMARHIWPTPSEPREKFPLALWQRLSFSILTRPGLYTDPWPGAVAQTVWSKSDPAPGHHGSGSVSGQRPDPRFSIHWEKLLWLDTLSRSLGFKLQTCK